LGASSKIGDNPSQQHNNHLVWVITAFYYYPITCT
jgi:hypothetical protein